MNNYKLKIIVVLVVAFAAAAITKGNAYIKSKNTAVINGAEEAVPGYQQIVEEKTIDDEMAPVGFWEVSLRYPKITGGFPASVITKVNKVITEHVSKYSCSDLGDHTFTSETKYFDKELLSMTYRAMWMCATMPAPENTSGALTFNLITGEPLLLSSEFIDDKASKEFFSILSAKIKSQTLAVQSQKEIDCPEITTHSYFYKTKNAITLVATAPFHRFSGCTTELEFGSNEMKRFFKPDSLLLK